MARSRRSSSSYIRRRQNCSRPKCNSFCDFWKDGPGFFNPNCKQHKTANACYNSRDCVIGPGGNTCVSKPYAFAFQNASPAAAYYGPAYATAAANQLGGRRRGCKRGRSTSKKRCYKKHRKTSRRH